MATKKCLVCGKEFKACNTCNKNIGENLQWRRVVCCPEHLSYHMPIISYVNGRMSKEDAKAELEYAIKLYGNIEFCDNIKAVVQEILADKKASKKNNNVKSDVSVSDVIDK